MFIYKNCKLNDINSNNISCFDSKKKVSDNNILENEKKKKINIIESISNQETDNEINSSDEENFFQEKQENIKNEGKKLCILDMLKKISRKKNYY